MPFHVMRYGFNLRGNSLFNCLTQQTNHSSFTLFGEPNRRKVTLRV